VDIFNLPNTSSRIISLGSTQPLREMSSACAVSPEMIFTASNELEI
jgi:hypothetical protein